MSVPIRVPTFVTDGGPWMKHDMPCAVCCAVCCAAKAVYVLHTGILQPCWECQRNGFRLVRLPWIWRWFSKRSEGKAR